MKCERIRLENRQGVGGGGYGPTPPFLTPFYSTGKLLIKGDVDGIPTSPDSRKKRAPTVHTTRLLILKVSDENTSSLHRMLWWHCLFSMDCCAVLRIRGLSRILILSIPFPGSRISDPGFRIQQEQQKRRGKILVAWSFCSYKFYRNENYLKFEQVQKKFEPIDRE